MVSLQSCQHNTEGPRCDKCRSGYFGDPSRGRPDDCKPCPCPYYETSRRWGGHRPHTYILNFMGQGVKNALPHTEGLSKKKESWEFLLSFFFFKFLINPFFWISSAGFPTLASWTSTSSRHATPAGPATQEDAAKSEIANIWCLESCSLSGSGVSVCLKRKKEKR